VRLEAGQHVVPREEQLTADFSACRILFQRRGNRLDGFGERRCERLARQRQRQADRSSERSQIQLELPKTTNCVATPECIATHAALPYGHICAERKDFNGADDFQRGAALKANVRRRDRVGPPHGSRKFANSRRFPP
jgi:hypothetical protein